MGGATDIYEHPKVEYRLYWYCYCTIGRLLGKKVVYLTIECLTYNMFKNTCAA